MADTDCASESASSVCDEERVRRLFQACDTNGDGFIDSDDLVAVCRELSLEESIDELMQQLGADSQGRISYAQFHQRRVALRPEIEALKGAKNVDNSSENSQGKLDSWEWDSGTRDMSPVPKRDKTPHDSHHLSEDEVKERLQQHLDEQAQRYEEQLTELHSVIAELTRKLHQQRSMAIAEEDEVSEVCTSTHEDSVTCPLEVSELEAQDNDLSDQENKAAMLRESPLELPDPKLTPSRQDNYELSPFADVIEPLKQEIVNLKSQLLEAQAKLMQYPNNKIDDDSDEKFSERLALDSPGSHIEVYPEEKPDIKYSNIVPVHKSSVPTCFSVTPTSKVAERIKLRRTTDAKRELMNAGDLINTDLPTAVAEHIVGDILRQCDTQTEKQAIDIEFRRLAAKLEHTRAQNSVLALTLAETKAQCDRLALLCGKYESNAIALRLALGITDRAIEAYDVLLALLETEVGLNENSSVNFENRAAAESVGQQLLSHLDSFQNTDILLSPWQSKVFSTSSLDSEEPWTCEHERRLREHVSKLKAERSKIQGTYVALESPQMESTPVRPAHVQEARKMDLEMAVLLQELMGLREDKAELMSKVFTLEKDKGTLELKLKYIEGQQKAQTATLKNIQGQLKDTEALLVIASQTKDQGYSDAEHAQGIEFELMQALAREARLKVRLQELVSTLEQVTKNAEARLLEGREMVNDLNHTNTILAETVDRNHKKYQVRIKKMEQQIVTMVERHNDQIKILQQRIAALETPPTNSSENSLNSLAM